MARPSKFKPEYIEQADKLSRLGATIDQIADFFEVGRKTVYNWMAENEEFLHAINKTRDEWDQIIEQSLAMKAMGYERDGKWYPPDTTAQIFWLKNRQSGKWKDVKERVHEHRTEEGDANMIELARRIAYLFQEGLDASQTQH